MDKPLRILMYSDHFGGHTTTFLVSDLKGLAENNKVTYACIGRTEGQFSYSDVRVLPYTIGPFTRKWRWILEKNGWHLTFRCGDFSLALNALLDEIKPDIIQCNFGYEALRLTDNLAERHKRIPIVINFLGYDASYHLERDSYVKKLKEIAVWKNVYATCNTGFLKSNLEKKGVRFQRNEVIYTGVDTTFFTRGERKRADDMFVFLQIAILAERKGQAVTIEAFNRFLKSVADPTKYRLVIAGGVEGEYGKRVRLMPKEMGIEGQVVFHDWITREQARELMNNADVFVHHSMTVLGRTEGIPTAVSESMAMELPVLSTWHAGLPELVENGVNGFLIKEGDVADYAEKMKSILSFGRMPENREKVAEKFNIRKRTEFLLELYSSILNDSN